MDPEEDKQKPKRVYFYRLNPGKRTDYSELQTKIITLYNEFFNRDYSNAPDVTINGERIFISAMSKFETKIEIDTDGESFMGYALLLNIQRVDPHRDVEYGVLTKSVYERRKTLKAEESDSSNDDIGPLVNTEILFDPFRRIICRTRNDGDLSNYLLTKFIKQAFDIKGAKLDIILDQKGLDAIDSLDATTLLKISVSSPDNFNKLTDDSRNEFAEMKMAKQFNTEKYSMVLSGPNLKKARIKKKLKEMLAEDEKYKVEQAEIEGLDNGNFEPVNLIKNKLIYSGAIHYREHENITIKHYFALLEQAFKTKFKFIQSQFALE